MKLIYPLVAAVMLSGCVDTSVTTRDPVTGIETTTRTRAPAPGSMEAAAQIAAALAARKVEAVK